MHPENLSITLFVNVAAFTPGLNNFVAFYSGFNFGILRTLPHIIGVTLGFPFLLLCLAWNLVSQLGFAQVFLAATIFFFYV